MPLGTYALRVPSNPESINTIDSKIEEIKEDLKKAECGGWVPFEEAVGMSIDSSDPLSSSYIAEVTGVPGTDGEPLGNIPSGMAIRDEIENFQFPEDTVGITSACRPESPPFYLDHPCQRPGPDVPSYPDLGGKIYANGINANSDPLGGNVKWTCDALCDDMNRRWGYLVWTESCPEAGEGEDPPNEGSEESPCYDSDLQPTPTHSINVGDNCSVSSEWYYCCTRSTTAPNCLPCSGEYCRGQHYEIDGNVSNSYPYLSYYRRYVGSCDRRDLGDYVPDDDISFSNVPVSCYGLYVEYDTQYQASPQNQFKCIIANTYEGEEDDFTNMWQTQKPNYEKVEFGKRASENIWEDPPSEDFQITASRIFNEDTNLWYTKLGGGFSLANEEMLEKENWDLSNVLLSPGESKIRTYPQLTVNQPFSSGSLIRSFDETVTEDRGEKRTIVEWWQELETQMSKLLLPPKVKLILPTPWTMGLDLNDPFYVSESQKEAEENTKSIEVILQIKDDLLGETAGFLERSSLLHLQEEIIPVLLPLADPIELRAQANLWCTWAIFKANKERGDGAPVITSCAGASSDVAQVIQRLREYADHIEDVRILRGDLYHYEGTILERQKQIIYEIKGWHEENIYKFDEYVASLNTLDDIREKWKRLQAAYINFHDVVNMPWCLNERFTLPIYSLLDDGGIYPSQMDNNEYWFPGREINGNLDGGIDEQLNSDNDPLDFKKFPRIKVKQEKDIVINTSNMAHPEKPIILPVLKPIQVKINWSQITPSSVHNKNLVVPDPLPPLPPIPEIREIIRNGLAKLERGDSPPLITSKIPEPRLNLSNEFLARVEDIIARMTYSYERFWKSLMKAPEEIDNGKEEDCFIFGDTCVHTEMDLLERFQRMCSRPGILLPEDFKSIGQRRDANEVNTCKREDWACEIQQGQTVYPADGWHLQSPKEEDQQHLIDFLRNKMFIESLYTGQVPYEVKYRDLIPPFDTHEIENILPPVINP